MNLKPKKCYTYHYDLTKRFHIPIETNDKCFFIVDKKVIQFPADGNYYILDKDIFANGNSSNSSVVESIISSHLFSLFLSVLAL